MSDNKSRGGKHDNSVHGPGQAHQGVHTQDDTHRNTPADDPNDAGAAGQIGATVSGHTLSEAGGTGETQRGKVKGSPDPKSRRAADKNE